MNNLYLRELNGLLRSIPESDRKELLQDYEEHFRLAEAEGKTAEEIGRALGDPRVLADDILADYKARSNSGEVDSGNGGKSGLWRKWPYTVVLLTAIVLGACAVYLSLESNAGGTDGTAITASTGSTAVVEPQASPNGVKDGGRIDERRSYPLSFSDLTLDTVNHNIKVVPSEKKELLVAFEGNIPVKEGQSWRDYYELVLETSGHQLRVQVNPKPGVQIPAGASAVLRLEMPAVKLTSLQLHTVSGEIAAAPVLSDKIEAATVSGSMYFERLEGNFELHSISGSIRALVSGWTGKSTANSVSGGISIQAVEKLDYAFELTSISGALECGYDEKYIEQKRKNLLSGSLGDKSRSLTLSSISGKLRLEPI